MVIQSPPGWGWDQVRVAVHEIGAARPEEYWHGGAAEDAPPAVRRIGVGDLWDALARGACRLRGEPHRRHLPVCHLPGDRPGAGPARLGLRTAAAAVPAGIGLRAGRSVRRRRAERDKPTTRARRRGALGGRIRRAALTLDRVDHVARPDADRAVPALAGRGADHLPRHTRPAAAGIRRRASSAMCSPPGGLDDDRRRRRRRASCSRCWCWRSAWCRSRCCWIAMSGSAPRFRRRCAPSRRIRASWRYGV